MESPLDDRLAKLDSSSLGSFHVKPEMNEAVIQPSARAHRRAWAGVGLATILGAILRLWGLTGSGLTHFDEGIYATSALWVHDPAGLRSIDPSLIPYAPPGYPICVGLMSLSVGSVDRAALLGSALFGAATIPIVGWLGTRAFGPGAGVIAALLAATSGAHIAFSRAGLTDSAFTFWLLLTLAVGTRFLGRPTLLGGIGLGLAVGLSQNFKYHGVLGGLSVAMAAASFVLFPDKDSRRRWVGMIGWGSLAILLAGVLYWPWYRFVDSHGGYADLLRHQRSYLTARSVHAWLTHWWLQSAQQDRLSGRLWSLPLGPIGAAIAVLLAASLISRPRLQGRIRDWGLVLLTSSGVAILALLPGFGWWLSGASFLWFTSRRTRPAVRVLGLTWLLFAFLTPFYHPYARLGLPLHATGWVLIGGLLAQISGIEAASTPRRNRGPNSRDRNSLKLWIDGFTDRLGVIRWDLLQLRGPIRLASGRR